MIFKKKYFRWENSRRTTHEYFVSKPQVEEETITIGEKPGCDQGGGAGGVKCICNVSSKVSRVICNTFNKVNKYCSQQQKDFMFGYFIV